MTDEPPAHLIDWQRQGLDARRRAPGGASERPLHGRRSASARRSTRDWDDPQGVPIAAFIFGGRRSRTVPLVYQAFNWNYGVYMAATMGSETTAAAVGARRRGAPRPVRHAAVLRLPHGRLLHALAELRPPAAATRRASSRVNWFRKDADGKFPLARLRREHARARSGSSSALAAPRSRSRARSAGCRGTRTSTGAASTSRREQFDERDGRSTATRGRRRSRATTGSSSASTTGCRRSSSCFAS